MMKLIRYYNPSSRLSLLDSAFNHSLHAVAPRLRSRVAGDSLEVARTVEWFEDDGNYHARVEIPGFKRDEIRLDAEGGLIRITCEVVNSAEETVRGSRRLEQVLRYPEGVRADGIEARLADGILHLTLPKEEMRKAVAITIH